MNPLKALLLQHLRPVSTMDSGLYSTSESDHEEPSPKQLDRSLEGTVILLFRNFNTDLLK